LGKKVGDPGTRGDFEYRVPLLTSTRVTPSRSLDEVDVGQEDDDLTVERKVLAPLAGGESGRVADDKSPRVVRPQDTGERLTGLERDDDPLTPAVS